MARKKNQGFLQRLAGGGANQRGRRRKSNRSAGSDGADVERGSTRIPREARWIALMMSRPWVSFEMQAVAPNDRSWFDSAAVGRLASTTIRVSALPWWSW